MKSEEKVKKGKGKFYWIIGTSIMVVALLFACQFVFGDNMLKEDTFFENTKINGVDVSGLTQKQAENLIAYNLLNTRDEVNLKLNYKDQSWTFSGGDFEIASDIDKDIEKAISYGNKGNFFEKIKLKNKIKKEGLNLNISYKNVLGGIENKVDEIIATINQDAMPYEVVFSPDGEDKFEVLKPQNEIRVEREALLEKIEKELSESKTAEIEIPTTEMITEIDEKEILSHFGLRSSFSTNYQKSSNERKTNIKKALSVFNGMVVKPGERISFNEQTGPRTEENGYKKANIILNGVYVEGAGGGVCQASTTLYNALILSGVDVLEANHHSLPASYVPLSLDAMVSDGTSDMVFQNNFDYPLYIRTFGNDTEITVEIYGEKLKDGEEYKTRAELVKILPHSGDRIVKDVNGDYSNFIIYQGEYYRLKYPKEGYESKAYVDHYERGELVSEREIRHDFYYPQEGIIMEGTEEVTDGITIPPNTVTFIPPQEQTETSMQNVRVKISRENPSNLNP